jgi:hypothetical protein
VTLSLLELISKKIACEWYPANAFGATESDNIPEIITDRLRAKRKNLHGAFARSVRGRRPLKALATGMALPSKGLTSCVNPYTVLATRVLARPEAAAPAARRILRAQLCAGTGTIVPRMIVPPLGRRNPSAVNCDGESSVCLIG